jgi:hypothetical protein
MQRKWCNSENVVAGTDRDDSADGPFSLETFVSKVINVLRGSFLRA